MEEKCRKSERYLAMYYLQKILLWDILVACEHAWTITGSLSQLSNICNYTFLTSLTYILNCFHNFLIAKFLSDSCLSGLLYLTALSVLKNYEIHCMS